MRISEAPGATVSPGRSLANLNSLGFALLEDSLRVRLVYHGKGSHEPLQIDNDEMSSLASLGDDKKPGGSSSCKFSLLLAANMR